MIPPRPPVPTLLILALCAALAGCGMSRSAVESMRHERDPAKSAANLSVIAKALASEAAQAPDVRCSLFDVGCALAAGQPDGGGTDGAAVRASALAEIAAPRLPAEPLSGLAPDLARERLRVWAAYAVARYAPDQALPRLVPLLGDETQLGGDGLPLQAAALLAVDGALDRIAGDPALATEVRRGALRLAALLQRQPIAAGPVERRLVAVLGRLCDASSLAGIIADQAEDEAVRIAAISQAHVMLAGWVAAGAVPSRERQALPRLCSTVLGLAVGPDSPLRASARDLVVAQIPYALLAQVPDSPERQLEAVLLLPRLGALAAHRPVGDLRMGLGPAAAVIDPAIALPGLDVLSALQGLVDQTCTGLTRFQGEDRWVVLEILATWAPATLAHAFASTWEAGTADVATARDWLAAMSIARRRNGTPAALAQIANLAANIVGARPPAGDPEPLWHLLTAVAEGYDDDQTRAFAAVLAGEHRLDDVKAAQAARFLVAAMTRTAGSTPRPASWPSGIAALCHICALKPFAPARIAIPFLLEHAPDGLAVALIERSAEIGLDDIEAVLAMDAALRAKDLALTARAAGLAWLGTVCSGAQDGDVRHAAARSILELGSAGAADAALVAAAVKACPVFAPLIPAVR